MTIYGSGGNAQLIHWHSSPQPENGHHGLRTTRVDGVVDWLLEKTSFAVEGRGMEDSQSWAE